MRRGEGDLEDDPPRIQIRILVPAGVKVADDPRPSQVCHDREGVGPGIQEIQGHVGWA